MFLETIGPNSLYDLKAFRDFVCVKMKSLCIEISLQNKAGQMIDEYIPSLRLIRPGSNIHLPT